MADRRARPGPRRHIQAPAGHPIWLADSNAGRDGQAVHGRAGGPAGPPGAGSSGAGTARHGTAVRPLKREKDFVETAQEYLKYHTVAVPGLQIMLESDITPGSVNGMAMLPPMPGGMGRQGLSPGLPVFHADRGYDSNHSCQMPFGMGIVPNIRQRGGAVNRGKPRRSRAAKTFDKECRQRGVAGGVFGGEGSKRHQPHCRFIPPDNRRRFGKIRAVAWNVKALNRLRCARMRGMEMPSHGTAPCAWPHRPGRSADEAAAGHVRKRDQMELRNNPPPRIQNLRRMGGVRSPSGH